MKCPPYKFLAFGSGELLSSLPIRPLTFHIFDFFSETTEGILIKLDRKQVLKVLSQVCSFQPDWPRGGSRAGQNRSKKVPLFKNLLPQNRCMNWKTVCFWVIYMDVWFKFVFFIEIGILIFDVFWGLFRLCHFHTFLHDFLNYLPLY